jgi:hypothetical protein
LLHLRNPTKNRAEVKLLPAMQEQRWRPANRGIGAASLYIISAAKVSRGLLVAIAEMGGLVRDIFLRPRLSG